MPISERDIKLLWGKAAGRCAFPECRIRLSQDKKTASDVFPFGEQAHIVGESDKAARGISLLTIEERNSYPNLILLCPNHHRIIDNNPEDYPIEKLHMLKSQHELWVEENLAEASDLSKVAENLVYTDLIDSAVKYCNFDGWDSWAGLLTSPIRKCRSGFVDEIIEFSKKEFKTIWPGKLPELERAVKTLSMVTSDMIHIFTNHVESKGEWLFEDRVYTHAAGGDPEQYIKICEEYEHWGKDVDDLVVEATKAANWLADVVRRDINPTFYITKGKFSITYGPLEDLSLQTIVPEYTEEERGGIPFKTERFKT